MLLCVRWRHVSLTHFLFCYFRLLIWSTHHTLSFRGVRRQHSLLTQQSFLIGHFLNILEIDVLILGLVINIASSWCASFLSYDIRTDLSEKWQGCLLVLQPLSTVLIVVCTILNLDNFACVLFFIFGYLVLRFHILCDTCGPIRHNSTFHHAINLFHREFWIGVDFSKSIEFLIIDEEDKVEVALIRNLNGFLD